MLVSSRSSSLETHEDGQLTRSKEEWNVAYKISGGTILFCLIGIGILKTRRVDGHIGGLPAVLVLQSVALLAFSAAWVIKDEVILCDRPGELRRPKRRATTDRGDGVGCDVRRGGEPR
jgi:hypothetical protein